MTLKEVIDQVYDLSVGGYFNGEKFTKTRFTKYINNMFKTGNRLVMQIALPDGRWFFSINKLNNNGYDYYIPETREQEKKVRAFIGI